AAWADRYQISCRVLSLRRVRYVSMAACDQNTDQFIRKRVRAKGTCPAADIPGTERLRHAVGGDVTVGRPDPAGGDDINVAMPERLEFVDDRSLLVADLPHFLEIDADRRQIFRDIADVLVLGAAGQDLATDHQERGRDNLFGSGRSGGHCSTPWKRTTGGPLASREGGRGIEENVGASSCGG